MLAATLAVTGCSSPSPSGNSPTPSTASTVQTSPTQSAEPTQPPTAAEVLADKVKESLTALAATTESPNRDQMKEAMLNAGADGDKLEISIDKTPTGLAVDAIEAAAALDKQCIVGQVRKGQASVTILPILDSGRCFVGDQH